jgi:tripartite-type tricarboxylate transporter receptor subunit TctC
LILPLIRSGKIKAYAVSTPARFALLPDVPTFRELGYPQLEAIAWMGLWVNPEVPSVVQTQIREAALKALGQPAVRDRLRDVGFDAGLPRSVPDMTRGLRADYERVGAVLKSIDFKPE